MHEGELHEGETSGPARGSDQGEAAEPDSYEAWLARAQPPITPGTGTERITRRINAVFIERRIAASDDARQHAVRKVKPISPCPTCGVGAAGEQEEFEPCPRCGRQAEQQYRECIHCHAGMHLAPARAVRWMVVGLALPVAYLLIVVLLSHGFLNAAALLLGLLTLEEAMRFISLEYRCRKCGIPVDPKLLTSGEGHIRTRERGQALGALLLLGCLCVLALSLAGTIPLDSIFRGQ